MKTKYIKVDIERLLDFKFSWINIIAIPIFWILIFTLLLSFVNATYYTEIPSPSNRALDTKSSYTPKIGIKVTWNTDKVLYNVTFGTNSTITRFYIQDASGNPISNYSISNYAVKNMNFAGTVGADYRLVFDKEGTQYQVDYVSGDAGFPYNKTYFRYKAQLYDGGEYTSGATFFGFILFTFSDGCTESLTNTSRIYINGTDNCRINDTQYYYYNYSYTTYDINNCGYQNLSFQINNSIAENGSCNYCSYSLTNTSFTSWLNMGNTCNVNGVYDIQMQNRTQTTYDINYNSCCAITGLGTDCFTNVTFWQYQNISCNYCSYNISSITYTQNMSSCINNLYSDNVTSYYWDSNYWNCYYITNIASDLFVNSTNTTYNYNISCGVYVPPSNNQTSNSSGVGLTTDEHNALIGLYEGLKMLGEIIINIVFLFITIWFFNNLGKYTILLGVVPITNFGLMIFSILGITLIESNYLTIYMVLSTSVFMIACIILGVLYLILPHKTMNNKQSIYDFINYK